MLKNYDPAPQYGVHTVRLTFMWYSFVGHLAFKVRGNCKGLGVMDVDFIDELTIENAVENDCDLRFDDEQDLYRFTFKDEDGKPASATVTGDELPGMIVGIEIVDFEERIT